MVETCVIGGGLAGITCARELARAGHSVALLEASRIGWAASGRNGGFVSDGFAEGLDEIEARVGIKGAQKLYSLSRDGTEYVRKALGNLGKSELLQGEAALGLVRHGDGAGLKEQALRHAELYGTELRFVEQQELMGLVNSPVYKAGLLKKTAFQIQPLAYACALADDAEQLGAQIFEQTAALSLKRGKDSWVVQTPNGQVSAKNIVLATSAYGGIFKPLENALVPVSTYVVSSKPLGHQLDDVINFTGAISDSRRAGDYYRVVGKGDERRLIWGGRITTRTSQPMQLAQMLKNDIVRIYPQLKELEVERAWAGLMGYARHKMPLIGELWGKQYPGIWVCTGYGGSGLNTTAMGGVLIAEALAKGDDKWRAFEGYGPEWTGGPLGKIAVQLNYWGMQMRDVLDERK